MAKTTTGLEVEPLAPFGAVCRSAPIAGGVSPELVEAVKRALEDHQLLIFRGHGELSDEDLVSFARPFGYLEPTPIAPDRVRPGFPEIYVVSNVMENGKAIGIGRGASFLNWHTDLSFVERVSTFGFLEAVDVPDGGGETMFTNMYLLFEELPIELRDKLMTLSAMHESDAAYAVGKLSGGAQPEEVHEKRVDDPAIMRARHPVVVVHPSTKRRGIYLNPQNVNRVDGVTESESAELLERVFGRVGSPDVSVEHHWQSGDLAVYDQVGLIHARRSFDGNERRYMRQITVQAEDPSTLWLA